MKRMKKAFAALMMFMITFSMFAVPMKVSAHPDRVVDDAGLLSSDEVLNLEMELDEISKNYEIDVAVVTVDSFSQSSVVAAADDFYDYNGYGLGDKNSGLLLYVCMSSRDVYITTCGEAISIFSDSDIDAILDQVAPNLTNGNYYRAFEVFAELAESEIKEATTFHTGRYLVISLAIGFIVAFIYVASLKSKLKSVSAVNTAANYVVNGTMRVTNSRELYLYRTMHVTKRESSSSGGSSTHRSSSGVSHGGGGRKF